MPRGKKSRLSVEVYRQLKAEGLSRAGIAEKLGLDPTAISKWTARHKQELESASVDTSYATKPKAPEIDPDSVDILLKHSMHLQEQIDKMLGRIDKSSGSEQAKNIELLIKLSQENRQILVGIAGIQDKLDDRRVMFGLWKSVIRVLGDKLPIKLRDEVVQALWEINSPYVETFKPKSEVVNHEQQAD